MGEPLSVHLGNATTITEPHSVQLGNATTIPLVDNVQSTDVLCVWNSPCQVHKMQLSSSDGGRARLPSRDMNSENTMRAWWSLIHWCLEWQSTHGGDTNSENTEVWFTGVWKHCGDMNSENTDAWFIGVWKDSAYKHTWWWHEQWKYRSPIHWCLETLWWYEQSEYRSLIHWCLERQQLNLWIPCCYMNSEYTEWFYRSLIHRNGEKQSYNCARRVKKTVIVRELILLLSERIVIFMQSWSA